MESKGKKEYNWAELYNDNSDTMWEEINIRNVSKIWQFVI